MATQKYDANEILKQMAAEAVKQQPHVRAAVRDLTLSALEAREFGVNQIKKRRTQDNRRGERWAQ